MAENLADILLRALHEIDEVGGSERHSLRQIIGEDAYNGMLANPRLAALIDKWVDAGPKTKAAATHALAIGVVRHLDRPDLLARIKRELADHFLPAERSPTPSQVKKHRAAINQKRNGQRGVS